MYPSPEELISLLNNFEDNFVERKPVGAGDRDFRKTLVAFGNSVPVGRTAVLFIGVDNAGAILGLGDKSADSLQQTLFKIATDKCFPPIAFKTECLNVGGEKVLAVIVPASKEKPHFAGPAFVRIGARNQIASESQYQDLITSRNSKAWPILQLKGRRIVLLNPSYRYQHTNGILVGKTFGEVVHCDSQRVRVLFKDGNKERTFPIEKVILGFDDSEDLDSLEILDRIP